MTLYGLFIVLFGNILNNLWQCCAYSGPIKMFEFIRKLFSGKNKFLLMITTYNVVGK